MISFQGITDLKEAFRMLSVQRLSWLFMHREAPALAKALGVKNIQQYRGEKAKIAVLKNAVMLGDAQDDLPRCDCDTPPAGRRWMRADEAGSAPIRYYIMNNVPERFHERTHRAFQEAADVTKRLTFEQVFNETDAEVIVKYEPYDGPGNTLGVTIYWVDNTDDMDVGIPVELIIDSNDDNLWADLDVYETVMGHEIEHVKGIGHAPEEDAEQNRMAAFFHGVFLRYGPWDRQENTTRYGTPDIEA